jgi:tetratricopeptide (TPR) repeat protein
MSPENKANTKDERFEKLVTVLISSVAILVAITAYFQNTAAGISDDARRSAQIKALSSTTEQINGVIQYSYQWQGAYQTWKEIDLQVTAAEQSGDEVAAERYRQLKEKIAALSPMLGSEYFDPFSMYAPDGFKYEADIYLVESTKLNEEYLAESEIGRVADNIADSFIVQITLLTVTLSLYGLSITLKGKVRWLFVIVGSGIVAVCLLWMAWELLLLWTRPTVSIPAINAYAEGVGLYHQAKDDEAIAKFNVALAEKPDYARAAYDRGNAYFYKGNLDQAIQDYELARQLGLDDASVNWNLGWTYYLNGQSEEAIQANNRVLSDDPSILGVRMNQGLTYLAMGDLSQAKNEYDLLIQEAEKQVSEAHSINTEPSASLWYYMDAGAVDLQNLIDQLEGNPKSWTQAPTADLVTGDHSQIRDFAYQQMVRLKEATVSLEVNGHLPQAAEGIQVEPFVFGKITETDDQGFITGFEKDDDATFPSGTNAISMEFAYTGTVPTQNLIWKVYFNGREDQSLRQTSETDLSTGSVWYKTFGYDYTNVFVLSSGEYVVELYADSRLVQRGTFFIENPSERGE